MTDILNKSMVLVLNRNWQAINVRHASGGVLHDGLLRANLNHAVIETDVLPSEK